LVLVWATRLTHSYFRREEWIVGHREDWRFTDLKEGNPKTWWLLSFFAAFLSQQPMLIGISLPCYAVNFPLTGSLGAGPLGRLDIGIAAVCLGGMAFAYLADSQLRTFMVTNEEVGAGPTS
jgi:steroid 5-alpha reductase family enzyme